MTKDEFDFPKNLLMMAEAKGTRTERRMKMTRNQLDKKLRDGCVTLQSKLAMLEAFKAVAAGKPKLVKEVTAIYETILKELAAGDTE